MTNHRCGGHHPANVARHLADAQRDATAVYRAVLRSDAEGVAAILNHTGCHSCVIVCATLLGLALGARTPADVTEGGWAAPYAEAVEDALTAADAEPGGLWGATPW
jgi:hypothetical protein